MHTFENQLSLDFRTKQSNALLLYTDDGGIQGNFYCLTIANKKLQLDFRCDIMVYHFIIAYQFITAYQFIKKFISKKNILLIIFR